MQKLFYFIGDLIKWKDEFPIEIFDEYSINRADDKQIKIIKNIINHYVSILTYDINKYESSYDKVKGGGYSIHDLEKSKWNYFVVEFPALENPKPLPLIFALSKLNLSLLFEASPLSVYEEKGESLYGTIQAQLRTINYFHDNHRRMSAVPETKTIAIQDKEELKQIDVSLCQFDRSKFPFIQK